MKRVKIMLMAITVLAAVGGTLAFKAAKTPLARFYTCNVGAPIPTCDFHPVILQQNATTTTPGNGIATLSATITKANVLGLDCINGVADCTKAFTAKAE
jgi:hypothetical protein